MPIWPRVLPYISTNLHACLGPSVRTISPHNALCHYSKQTFTTLYRRMNTQSQTPHWLLQLGRREVTTKRVNRIWKSCLLCTNLQRCLIIKISVHTKIVLKLMSLFIVAIFMFFVLCLTIIRESSANSPLSENGSVEWFLAWRRKQNWLPKLRALLKIRTMNELQKTKILSVSYNAALCFVSFSLWRYFTVTLNF